MCHPPLQVDIRFNHRFSQLSDIKWFSCRHIIWCYCRSLIWLTGCFDGNCLTHWGRDQIDDISQTTFSSAFSWMKMFQLRLKFHWSLFPRVQLAIIQHWFRKWLGAVQATSHYLNQWWSVYWRIYASLGLAQLFQWRPNCQLMPSNCIGKSTQFVDGVVLIYMQMAMTNLYLFLLHILTAHINHSISGTICSLLHMNRSKCNH